MENRKQITCVVFFVAILLFFSWSIAQIRAGAAFLKMLPGTRLHSMAASHTAVFDDPHALYANPAATGFLREWQWSATYTKWIADIYNASFVYGRGLRTPWSRHTRFAVGVLYQGVPEFDSSERTTIAASANDMIFGLGVGQPLTFLSRNISVGSQVKYFNSNLDTYSASAMMMDVGLTAHSRRFHLKNPFLKYAILSAGVAYNHWGQDLTYESVATPLPESWRAGVGLYLGTHRGIQMLFTADYDKVRDEKSTLGMGAEINWGQRISLHGGYDFDADLMNKMSFGLSIQMDDVLMPNAILPGRSKALSIDLATLDEEQFFSRTFRGGVNHYPIGPEAFRFISPKQDSIVTENRIMLDWEESYDPDLYDDVTYILLVDQHRSRLDSLLTLAEKNLDTFYWALMDSELLVNHTSDTSRYLLEKINGGDHYWGVIARDLDGHIRFAESNGERIQHFYVPLPDLLVHKVEFNYSPWITRDDYHGDIIVIVENQGDRPALDVGVQVSDTTKQLYRHITGNDESSEALTQILKEKKIQKLDVGERDTLTFEWHTPWLGVHQLGIDIDPENAITELSETNNNQTSMFATIPKGTFSTQDSVNVLMISRVSIDMPIITEIAFDPQSAHVKHEYLRKTTFDPPLATFAQRLINNPRLSITLKGFVDPNSEPTIEGLADLRSNAIQDSLVAFGVKAEQIEILQGEVLPKRRVPANPQDAEWVFEERRHVEISADESAQAILFLPVRHTDNEEVPRAVDFRSDIHSAVSIFNADLVLKQQAFTDSSQLDSFKQEKSVVDRVLWSPERITNWSGQSIEYQLVLNDSLGRSFKTHTKPVYLKEEFFQREHRIAFPMKFAQTDPLYSFYWARLFEMVETMIKDPSMKMKFTGHACAVGPVEVNARLSKKRANRFHQDFLEFVRNNHPSTFNHIASRIEPAEGYGEGSPLAIERISGEIILIGDNDKALGRQLNRRIEIIFYSDAEPWKNIP